MLLCLRERTREQLLHLTCNPVLLDSFRIEEKHPERKENGGLSEWRRKEWPICLKTRQSKLPSFPLKTKRINQPRDRAGTRKNLCVHSSSVTFDPSSTCKERPRKERDIKKTAFPPCVTAWIFNILSPGALTMFPRAGANKQRTCRLAVSVDPPPTAVYRFHFAALSLSFYLLFWESRFLDYGKFASCIYFPPSSLPLFPSRKLLGIAVIRSTLVVGSSSSNQYTKVPLLSTGGTRDGNWKSRHNTKSPDVYAHNINTGR